MHRQNNLCVGNESRIMQLQKCKFLFVKYGRKWQKNNSDINLNDTKDIYREKIMSNL